MPLPTGRAQIGLCLSAALAAAQPALAADEDALDLQVSAAPAAPATPGLRLGLEAAALAVQRSAGQGHDEGHRVSVDLRWTTELRPGWRFGLSDRLDDQSLVLPGQRSTRNSLRELQLSWQDSAGAGTRTLDIGRVNQRHGQAYGFNPTDFFRTGATRAIVSADPVAIRENRSGTFMVSGSQLWSGGSVSLTYAPKLTSQGPSDKIWTWGFSDTNKHDRVLIATSLKASDRWSGEALAMHEHGRGMQYGLNVTGLLTDSGVLHLEWASLQSTPLVDRVLSPGAAQRRQQQAALGLTYTFPGGLSLTAEAEYNEAGLGHAASQALFAQGAPAVAAVFARAQADQELVSRRALLLYATKKDFLWSSLDLTAFVRRNTVDDSQIAWGEIRYHWPSFDLAVQLQRHSGSATTEYGALPIRRVLQVLVSQRF